MKLVEAVSNLKRQAWARQAFSNIYTWFLFELSAMRSLSLSCSVATIHSDCAVFESCIHKKHVSHECCFLIQSQINCYSLWLFSHAWLVCLLVFVYVCACVGEMWFVSISFRFFCVCWKFNSHNSLNSNRVSFRKEYAQM